MSEQPVIDKIPADTKNWTLVLEEGCAECGFQPGYPYEDNESRIKNLVAPTHAAFEQENLTQRPQKNTWSPLEYLAHISEVCEVMVQRLNLMVTQDSPTFPNWDQDAAAIEQQYNRQNPEDVERKLLQNLEDSARLFGSIPPEHRQHRGLRGNGAAFTVQTLAEYFVHDLEHHVHKDLGQ